MARAAARRGAADVSGVSHTWRMGTCCRWTLALLGAACLTSNVAGSASAEPAPVSPEAEAARLIDVRSVVPDAVIDLRYATANNFVDFTLYPAEARCLVHESLAPGLAVAANQLRVQGNRSSSGTASGHTTFR
jgi:D-alanyl-D-alanine dipeptidase